MLEPLTGMSYRMMMPINVPPMVLTGPASARLRVVYPAGAGSPRLRLHGCGVRERIAPGVIDRPKGTDDWLLMAFHDDAEVGVDDGDVPAPAGSLVVWQPHAPHRYGHPTTAWRHSWLHCDGDDARELISASGLALDVPIPGIDPRFLDRCIVGLHDEMRGHARPDGAILRNHLHTCLREAARAAHGAASARVDPRLLALRSHLEATFHERHTLRSLAARAGCSVPHLCARFRAAFGASPIAYVIELRLRRARLLLSERAATVAGVARAVGYDEYHHFSKLFHRRFGLWPSEAGST